MSANASDLLTYVALDTLTNLASPGYTTGASSINCDDLSNWPTTTAVYFGMDQIGADGKRIAGTYTEWKGIVSGNTIGSLSLINGTDQNYTAGSTVRVYQLLTAGWFNAIVDALLTEHKNGTNSGKHAAVTADSLTSTGDITTSTQVVADTIAEKTTAHGVTVDGLNIKDSAITTPNAVGPTVRTGGFFVGSFTVNATGAKSVTGVGFKPKGVIFMLLSGQSTAIATTFGLTDGTNQVSEGFTTGSGSGNESGTSNHCLSVLSDDGLNWRVLASITSLDSDGFTINVGNYSGGPYTIGFMAIA